MHLLLFIVTILLPFYMFSSGTPLKEDIQILTIIPARCGSKGIPHKNIKNLRGKPLIAWSILQAKQSRHVDNMRIIVSTDSELYAAIARSYGAETPFLRPKEISHDEAIDIQWAEHALTWLEEHENYVPDVVLQLRPTYPTRKVDDIDHALDIFLKVRDQYDSLRSVIQSEKLKLKMYHITDGKLVPFFKEFNGIKEPYNTLRNFFPDDMSKYYTEGQKQNTRYLHNGNIDIFNAKLIKVGSISGETIYPYIMEEEMIDIDTEEDWERACKHGKIKTKDKHEPCDY